MQRPLLHNRREQWTHNPGAGTAATIGRPPGHLHRPQRTDTGLRTTRHSYYKRENSGVPIPPAPPSPIPPAALPHLPPPPPPCGQPLSAVPLLSPTVRSFYLLCCASAEPFTQPAPRASPPSAQHLWGPHSIGRSQRSHPKPSSPTFVFSRMSHMGISQWLFRFAREATGFKGGPHGGTGL